MERQTKIISGRQKDRQKELKVDRKTEKRITGRQKKELQEDRKKNYR